MKDHAKELLLVLFLLLVMGCSTISMSENSPVRMLRATADKVIGIESKSQARQEVKVANPPAKTLRFDGHEIVLGQSENEAISTERLASKIESLIQRQRLQSAANLILLHRESAERLLSEQWASGAEDPVLQLAAEVLSRRSIQRDGSWSKLLETGESHRPAAIQYQNLRNAFAEELQTNDPSDAEAEQLLQASVKVAHPLARLDALRLLGLRELVAGRNAWAESQFRQAIELATSSGNPLIAAELWLTVTEAARRSNQTETASTVWANAIQQHLAAYKPDQPLDVSFWLLADKTRPESLDWPGEISTVLKPHARRIGCTADGRSEFVLWSSIADAQYERGQWQSALVNFKRAETLAESESESVMWLRIAQARCMAAMGQSPAASAILSGPAASSDPAVSAAATAAMGSIKLKTGAYQQGAQLLHKAVTQSPSATWSTKNQSLADLAVAQLIFGDTETGLSALHEVQELMQKAGERDLLVRCLENELRLMEHEGRAKECGLIREKIIQLERL